MSEQDKIALEPHFAWHASQWQHLMALKQSNRLPHALLLAGPPGIGKNRFAKALAFALLCGQGEGGNACGQCRQCQLITNVHPDLKLVEPEEGGRQIKIDQIRQIVSFILQTSHSGGYKISIISPAEAMNTNAANAVLKSLEEPTDNSLLILVSDSPGTLMPTIRSRCQLLYFPVPPQEEVIPWLTSSTANETLACQLLKEASGQPLTALDFLNTGSMQRHEEMEKDFLATIDGRMQPLTLAERWKDYALQDILSWLSVKFVDIVKAVQASQELKASWRPLQKASLVSVFGLIDKVDDLSRRVKRGANPNRQLVVEALLLDCCDVFCV